ncbi:hypothetical protein ACTJKZ_14840 [Pantoea sp. 22096]|uniref:hypothetical protein n=1 Tax=Pantoea sp. 22096 TaxID=3453873 RepID=UPI003F87E60C
MAGIFIDRKYSSICTKLVDDKVINTGEKIFKTYMDLAIFAAMVAVNKGKTPLENPGPEIPESVFFNNQKDGLVYLIALLDTKDPYILKDDKMCWKIFQDYVNTGMSEISGWLIESATDATGVDTLLNYIASKAVGLLDMQRDMSEIPIIDF